MYGTGTPQTVVAALFAILFVVAKVGTVDTVAGIADDIKQITWPRFIAPEVFIGAADVHGTVVNVLGEEVGDPVRGHVVVLTAVDGDGHAKLAQIGFAVGLTRLFVAGLHRDHQGRAEDAEDADYHQKLDERHAQASLA